MASHLLVTWFFAVLCVWFVNNHRSHSSCCGGCCCQSQLSHHRFSFWGSFVFYSSGFLICCCVLYCWSRRIIIRRLIVSAAKKFMNEICFANRLTFHPTFGPQTNEAVVELCNLISPANLAFFFFANANWRQRLFLVINFKLINFSFSACFTTLARRFVTTFVFLRFQPISPDELNHSQCVAFGNWVFVCFFCFLFFLTGHHDTSDRKSQKLHPPEDQLSHITLTH